jgi:hypothetical protein
MLPDTGIDDVKKQRNAQYAKHINDPVLSSLKMEGIRLLLCWIEVTDWPSSLSGRLRLVFRSCRGGGKAMTILPGIGPVLCSLIPTDMTQCWRERTLEVRIYGSRKFREMEMLKCMVLTKQKENGRGREDMKIIHLGPGTGRQLV